MKRILPLLLAVAALSAPSARAAAVRKTDFAKSMALTPSATALAKIGETAWADFPVLVRLPAEVSALLQSADGTDLFFTDENGASLPFEVEAFDPAGTTFVWVKVPSLSSATTLMVWFGGAANTDNDPTAVWSRYVGVWHYAPSEAGGTTVADATGHGLTGSTTGSLSTYAGPFAGDAIHSTATVTAPDYDALVPDASQFTASGWFKFPSWTGGTGNYFYFVSKKVGLNWDNARGWYVQMNQSKTSMGIVLGGSESFAAIPDVSENWNHFCVVSDGTTVKVYVNGSSTASISASHTITASGTGFAISPNKSDNCADEYRIRAGAASAAETALEYATMKDAAFFDLGSIGDVDPTEQVLETPTVVRNANGTYTVTVVLGENSGDVGVIYGAGATAVTNVVATAAAPGTFADTPANLSADTTYEFSAYGRNAKGTEVVKKGGIFYNGDLSVAKLSDADENGLVPGAFRISRGDTAHDLAVSYMVSGTAAPGQTFAALSGTATIPAGSTSVDIPVQPLLDRQTDANATVVLTLSAGLYGIAAGADGAELTIFNHRFVQPTDFRKKMTFTPSATVLATIGDSTFADFPVLVRLPAAASALLRSADGTDLLVADENGAVLSFEIDTFDPAGETLVWVKVPSLSASTELTAYFVGAANADNHPTDVWTDYVGVWHMNEASGTVADATGNGLGASPAKATAVSVAQASGAVGTARQTSTSDVKDYLSIPNYNSQNVGANFTFSCFYDATARKGYDRLVSRKREYNDGGGWEVEMANASNKLSARGASATSISGSFSDLVSSGWMRFAFVYSGTTLTAYLDGAQIGTGTIAPATDNGYPLSIGCDSDGSEAYFVGCVDEARLRRGAASAAEVALEYATMADAAFFDAGAIEDVDVTAPVVGVPVVTCAAGVFSIAADISENVPASVFYDADGVTGAMATAGAEPPMTYSAAISGLAEDTTYRCFVNAVSTGGSTIGAICPTAFYNGDLAVAKISDADETTLAPGVFRISRADSDYDLSVAYTVAGTAVAGRAYAALSGTATIPAGSSFVDVAVTPILDTQTDADTTVVLTLAAGLYGIDAVTGSATLTIVNHHVAEGFDFAKKMTLAPSATVLATIGQSTFADFPVLVRLPAEASAEFRTADGSDLVVTDENGTSLPFEVDTFVPAGETLVWVKVPELSAATELTVWFGGVSNVDNDPTAVWTDYVGVWHMNEASGTVADATGNGLGASPAKATAVSVAQAFGAVGTARQTATSDVKDYLTIPNYNSLGLGGNFTFSCFYDATARKGYDRLVSRKETHDAGNGWEVEMANASNKLSARGASATSISGTFSDLVSSGWMRFAFVYSGTTLTAYLDGAQIGTGTIAPATDNGYPLSIGCDSDGSEAYFVGYVDEARLRKGAASAAEVALEYATMADATFFDQGAVEDVDATAQKFQTPTVARNANGTYTVTVVLRENSGDVGAIYDAGAASVTNVLATAAAPGTFTDTPANLTADTTYAFSAYGRNANGTEVVAKGGVFYNGELSIAALSNAVERGSVPGAFRVSRADAAHDLVVNLSVAGTAVAGQTYEALPATVTIPAGATFVDVRVQPLLDPDTTADTVVSVSLAPGLYGVSASAGTADLTVENLVAPSSHNVWIAPADGLASVGSNWSAGHCPTAGENVLFDGEFSQKNCQWDADANDTVASWTQNANYTGTVQIDTTYDATFPALNVAGDVAILGGNWTHRINEAADGQKYHLKAIVSGDFTLASGCKLDAEMKGYWAQKYPAGSAVSAHAASYDGFDKIYGNVYRPADLGAGSYASGTAADNKSGGGAVWLEVGGAATLNGEINVRGRQFDGSNTACGSVYVKAKSCSGSGSILANFSAGSYYNGNRGSGGRVAIELTEATTLAFPTANVRINGINAGGSGGGGGTFYVKTADPAKPYGTLYLDDQRGKSYGARWHTPQAITAIPAGETWTFDAIVIRNYGMLAVPAGTTLNLPNGPLSISATSTRHGGIRYDGGTINWGSAPYEFASNWIFQANAPYVFDGDVIVHDGGAIGCLQFQGKTDFSNFTKCDITVNGNLTIEPGGYLYANGGGPDMNINRDVVSFHGGQSAGASGNKAYDSIFAPRLPGYGTASGDQATSAPGGGLLLIDVSGAFVNNGTVTLNGSVNTSTGSSGGSLNVTARTLSGTGTFSADTASGSSGSGGGGRIAVRLTGGSFADGAETNFFACGATVVKNGESSDRSSSAGTVYLQGSVDGEKGGTIYVRNDGNALNVNTYTPLPAGVTKADVEPDAAADFRKASLVVGDAARVKLFADLKMVELNLEADTALDLNGRIFTATTAHVGGVNVPPGTYTPASTLAIGDGTLGDYLADTADGAGGTLRVLGAATVLIVK